GGGVGAGKVFYCCDLDWLRVLPLECRAETEESLRAYAMGRMLAEPDSGVNRCEREQFVAGRSARRYRTAPCAKNRAWSSGRNRGHCMCSTRKATHGAGRLACLRRVC